jgi:hypothetical protein
MHLLVNKPNLNRKGQKFESRAIVSSCLGSHEVEGPVGWRLNKPQQPISIKQLTTMHFTVFSQGCSVTCCIAAGAALLSLRFAADLWRVRVWVD